MSEAIIIALITSGISLIGIIISNNSNNKKIQAEIKMMQAVTNTEVKELTREVREHNEFARRMPVVEEQIKVINRRIGDLEDFHKGGNN